MRRVLCAGGVALGALCLLVAFAGGTASATTLCSINVSPCAGVEFKSGSKLKATASSPVFNSSIGTVSCETSTFEGETTSDGGEGKAVEATLSSLTFTGNCHLGKTSCTLTTVSLPSGTTLSGEGGSGTLNLGKGGELTIKCGILLNCTYSLEEVELELIGGSPALAVIYEHELTKSKGICPKSTVWTSEYKLQAPEALYLVASPAPPINYAIYESYGGGCNIGLGQPPCQPNPGGGGGGCNSSGGCAKGAVGCNPATAGGVMPRCIVGDLVNAATGNLAKEQIDIGPLGGRGPALGITRSYNSQIAVEQSEAGPYGYGWSGPYSAHLTINEEAETATVRHDNGSAVVFYLIAGSYYPPIWSPSTLKKSGENYIYTLASQEQFKFNASGQLTEITDRHGNALTLTYKEGKLETVKDAAGRALTFAYEGAQVKSVKDPQGHEVKYTYESGNLATVTLPGEEKSSWEFKYDGSHQLTKFTDARGNTTKTEYDGSNRVKAQIDALERERKLEYKETGEIKETTITEPNGSKTFVKFNESGEPTEITKASGTGLAQTTKYEYSTAFELLKETDANNHAITYAYDLAGNRTSEKDANGNESTWTYNSTHDVLTETTPGGETTTYTRNASGDPETIKRPAPESKTQEVKFKWAANGDLEEETDPLSRKTKFEYEKYGNLKAEIDPAEDKATWTYDEDGMQITEVSPRGNEAGKEPAKFETKIKRDAQGRPELVTEPEGRETKYAYDAAGNLEKLTNSNKHATTYAYDAANQLIEVKAANGDVSKISYDSMGAVKGKTNGNSQTTKFERNSLGQLTETIDPLERATIRTYDAAGNLKELKDAAERTTTFSYDAGDRLEKVDYSDAGTADVTYKYSKDGQLTEMSDGTGTSKYAYDQLSRLTEAKNGNSETVKYEYNLGNEPIKVTYPNGKAISRAYDSAGRLEKVTDWLGGETKFAYNRDSALTSTTFPSGSTNKDEYGYDNAGDQTSTTMKRGAETLASLSYGRTGVGQLESLTQEGLPGPEELEYAYDERERLSEGVETSFKYDPANNPIELGATKLEYDAASQLKKAGTTKYTFNNLGERTKAEPEGGTATTYGWDQAGNLTSVTKSGSIEDTYAYDGNGLRASQKISGVKAQLTWDVVGALSLLIYDGTRYYLYGPDGLPFAQIASETPTYLHHDHLGSTRLLTDSEGKAKGKYTYTPYGAVEEQSGEAKTPLGFAGQYRNDSTGLIYLRKRVYDPVETSQFLSVDPIVSNTGEPYSYAGDDPVNNGDPNGLYASTAQQPPTPPYAPQPDSGPNHIGGGWYCQWHQGWHYHRQLVNGQWFDWAQTGWDSNGNMTWALLPQRTPPPPPGPFMTPRRRGFFRRIWDNMTRPSPGPNWNQYPLDRMPGHSLPGDSQINPLYP
jgi:RHS repeat-associated protein